MPFAKTYREASAMDLSEINRLLDEINEDRTVPRNIRTMVGEAKNNLINEKIDFSVRINSAISILDEVSNDTNIPTYTRTQIWNIVSLLEIMQNSRKSD